MKLALLYRRPLITILLVGAVTLFFALQLPDTRIDNDVLSFLPQEHPARRAVERQERLFGGVFLIDVVMEAREGSILTPEGLKLLIDVGEALAEIDGVEEIESMTTTDFLEGTPEGMRVGPILDPTVPVDQETVREVRRKLSDWDIYRRLLIDEERSATQIGVRYSTELDADEREEVYRKILSTVERFADDNFRFYVAGTPAVTSLVSRNMLADLSTLIPFVLSVLMTVLWISFRRVAGVLLPMLTVAISTVWTVGLMALLEIPLSVLGTVIPVLLLAVGSAYSIHLISHYLDRLNEDPPQSGESHRRLVLETVRRVGAPVTLAGLTTLIGFGALVVSRIVPMRIFGIFTALGVAFSLTVAILFLPSLLLLKRPRSIGARNGEPRRSSEKESPVVSLLQKLALRRPSLVALSALLLLGLAALGTTRLIVDNALIEYFKTDTDIRVSDRLIRTKFAGTKSFDIIVSGEEPGSLTDPRILTAMEGLADYLESEFSQVSRAISYSDFIRRMNLVMHAEGEEAPGEKSTAESGSASQEDYGDDSFFQESESQTSFDDDSFFTEAESEEPTAGEAPAELDPDAYDEIPADPARYGLRDREELKHLIAQYLLLYSGGLESWADDDLEPSIARISVSINTSGNRFTGELLPAIEAYAAEHFPPGYTYETAGIALAESAVTDLITGAAIKSILLSLGLVFLIVALRYRSPLAGLYGALPLGATVLINFGVMGLTGIKLDIATAMVGSIAIGIGIDYTIHFLAGYRRARAESDDPAQITRRALRAEGKAILYNALSVAAGFLVLGFSRFNPLMFLGILIALTMITSSLASLTMIPVLLNQFRPRFITPKNSTQKGVQP